MTVYLMFVLALLLSTNLLCKSESTKIGYAFASFLVFFFAAIRFDIGFDYDVYYNMLDGPIWAGLIRFEPLSLVVALPAIYWESPYVFFILSSFVIYYFVSRAFKKYSFSPALSLIIYVGIFYLISLSVIRQALAISICLFAYKYLIRKSFFKFFLCIALATLFHYSAAVSLLIYLVYHYMKPKYLIIILVIVGMLKPLVFSLLIRTGMYVSYLEDSDLVSGGSLTRILYILILLSYFLIIKRRAFTIEEKKILSVLIIGTFLPFFFGSIGERIGYYFLIYHCYAIPLFLVGKKAYKKKLYALLFSAYFLMMVGYTSMLYGNASPYTPYQTIFNVEKIEFR